MAPAAFAMQILPIAAPSPKPSATAPGGTIDALPATDSAARIAHRIRGIFSQLPSLAPVTVQVKQGVVTL
ncbi:MAG: MscS mechanosensitive ion channel, partial [Croceibacterium sp.]